MQIINGKNKELRFWSKTVNSDKSQRKEHSCRYEQEWIQKRSCRIVTDDRWLDDKGRVPVTGADESSRSVDKIFEIRTCLTSCRWGSFEQTIQKMIHNVEFGQIRYFLAFRSKKK